MRLDVPTTKGMSKTMKYVKLTLIISMIRLFVVDVLEMFRFPLRLLGLNPRGDTHL